MSKDIIYREDVIEAIHDYWKGELSKMPTTGSEYGEVIDGDCDTLLKHNKELSTRIKDIPSADKPSAVDLSSVYSTAYKSGYEKGKADRPQGEWIRDRYWSRGAGMGEDYGFFYKCSLCEYEVENGYTRCGFNFCPYCGADMRERKDERDYL